MKKIKNYVLFVQMFLFMSIVNAQTTYYFDNDSGDDINNSGLSSSSPWKSTEKFNSIGFLAGDRALFKRGQKWEEGSYLELNPGVRVGKYGATGPRPIISNLKTMLTGATWILEKRNGNDVWHTGYGSDGDVIPRLIVVDDMGNESELLKSTLLEDLGEPSAGTIQRWYYDTIGTNQRLYIVSEENPSTAFAAIKWSERYYTIIGREAHGAQIIDIEVQGGRGPAIFILNSSHVSIDHCTIGKYSGSGIQIRGDLKSKSEVCSNIYITDNWIDSGFFLPYQNNSLNSKTR